MSVAKKLLSLAVIAVTVFLAAFAGNAVAGNDPTAQPAGGSAPIPAAPNGLLGGGDTEDAFVAISPCRIADTRVAGGKLAVGANRTFDVTGSGGTFAAQGGTPGGCGIPDGTSAIEATITAIDAGSGFLRAWPAQGQVANATFMNYTPDFNVSNTGSLAINGCTASFCLINTDLRLRAFGSPTHVVVEVNGYYQRPLAAVVNADGTLRDGNRVVSTSNLGSGQYEVVFDRDVSQCAYTATQDLNLPGYIDVAPRSGNVDAVFVLVTNTSLNNVDRRFNLQVDC